MAVNTEDQSQRVSATRAWLVTLTVSLFFFYQFVQLNLFNAIGSSLMQSFKLTAPDLGQLGSMYFYANALFLFPAGILLDRYSPKKLVLFAVVLCTFATYLFAISQSHILAGVARFLVGISASFCFLSCMRIASRWFPPHKMAFATGMIVTMAMLGGLVAQTPLTLLNQAIGWRHAVMLDALLGVFITIAIALFVQDRPANSQEDAQLAKAQLQEIGFWRGLKLVLLNKYNWLGGLYTSLMNLPVFLLGALWGIHYLVQVHHVSAIEASYATTLFFIGVIIGSPVFGWFSDYIERRVFPMVLGAILSLGAIFILLCGDHFSLTSLIILFFTIGFVSSSQVLSYPTIAELNPRSLTSTAVSVDSITIMLSGAIFQPFFGWLMQLNWDHTTQAGVPVYAASDFENAMLIIPIAFGLSILIAFLIKETYCRLQFK